MGYYDKLRPDIMNKSSNEFFIRKLEYYYNFYKEKNSNDNYVPSDYYKIQVSNDLRIKFRLIDSMNIKFNENNKFSFLINLINLAFILFMICKVMNKDVLVEIMGYLICFVIAFIFISYIKNDIDKFKKRKLPIINNVFYASLSMVNTIVLIRILIYNLQNNFWICIIISVLLLNINFILIMNYIFDIEIIKSIFILIVLHFATLLGDIFLLLFQRYSQYY